MAISTWPITTSCSTAPSTNYGSSSGSGPVTGTNATGRPSPPNAMCDICGKFTSAIPCRFRCCWSPRMKSGCIPFRNCATPPKAGYPPLRRTCLFISTWPREKPRRFLPIFVAASRPWRTPTNQSPAPRASAEKSRCPRNSDCFRSDAGTSARQTNHGRNQEQHDRDEKDDLGDFDGGTGNAAKTQNACDQRDDQKRNDPAQHDQNLCFPLSVSTISATMSIAHRLRK